MRSSVVVSRLALVKAQWGGSPIFQLFSIVFLELSIEDIGSELSSEISEMGGPTSGELPLQRHILQHIRPQA